MSLCYTRQDLTDLSGYKQRGKIATWLRANGFVFYIGADGWPRVLVSSPAALTRSVPNANALKELQDAKKKNQTARSA